MGRLTRIVGVSGGSSGGNTGGNTTTTTFTTWDSAGRPTAATDTTSNSSITRTMTHNDTARTTTTVVAAAQLQSVETFDANGNRVRVVATGAAGSGTTETTSIAATLRVCK